MATFKRVFNKFKEWEKDPACPATEAVLATTKKIMKGAKNKPTQINVTGQGGIVLHWEKPMYRFKLRIRQDSELDKIIFRAIDMMGNHSGWFNRLFKRTPSFDITEKELDEDREGMLKELEIWRGEERFLATDEAVIAAEKALKYIGAKPQRIGVAGGDGIMMRWDSPSYVCKLDINGNGDLSDNILKAIDMLPEDHSGIYGAGGDQGTK